MLDGRTEVLYLVSGVHPDDWDEGTLDWFCRLDRTRVAPSIMTTQRSPNRWLHRAEPHAEEVWVLPDVMAGDDMPEFILGFVESRGVEVVHIMNSRLGIDLLPDLATLSRPPATVLQLCAGELDDYAATRYAGLIDRFSSGTEHEALYEELIAERPRVPPPTRPALVLEPLVLDRTTPPERSVAVVVPCFGHGRDLDACIGSIRAQTLPAAQIVVVDDASPDAETSAALDQLAADGDVTIVRLAERGGPSVARNCGLERVSSSYVLFLDADDMLLPEAIETLLGCLEGAPDDVAFAYPNALHFGNRHDYERKPDWNLYLLTFENFCPVTSLFDARVFAAGVAFSEDLRAGHEDWDLILQIASRGARGVRAPGPTFLYRKGGFSRVDAQHLARRAYAEELRERHPALFARVGDIKAQWAPAASVILLGGDGAVPDATTNDFEVLHATDADSLAAALAAARGTFAAVLAPEARALLERRDGIEQIVRILQATSATGFGVLAQVEGTPYRLSVLGDQEGELVALAWKRTGAAGASKPAELGVGASLLWDLAWGLEPLQWRALGVAA
jgi:GT2 family glycosyltransferase